MDGFRKKPFTGAALSSIATLGLLLLLSLAQHTSADLLPTCCSVVDVDSASYGTSKAAALLSPNAGPAVLVGDRVSILPNPQSHTHADTTNHTTPHHNTTAHNIHNILGLCHRDCCG